MLQNCGRRRQKEAGDGHCGFRALARQLVPGLAAQTTPTDATPEQIKFLRDGLAATIIRHASSVEKLVFAKINRSQLENEISSFSGLLASHAEALANSDSTRSCLHRQREWMGGPNGCDYIAIHLQTRRTVYVITAGISSVTVADAGGLQEIELEHIKPDETAIVLVWSGNHFDSVPLVCGARSPTEGDHPEAGAREDCDLAQAKQLSLRESSRDPDLYLALQPSFGPEGQGPAVISTERLLQAESIAARLEQGQNVAEHELRLLDDVNEHNLKSAAAEASAAAAAAGASAASSAADAPGAAGTADAAGALGASGAADAAGGGRGGSLSIGDFGQGGRSGGGGSGAGCGPDEAEGNRPLQDDDDDDVLGGSVGGVSAALGAPSVGALLDELHAAVEHDDGGAAETARLRHALAALDERGAGVSREHFLQHRKLGRSVGKLRFHVDATVAATASTLVQRWKVNDISFTCAVGMPFVRTQNNTKNNCTGALR